MKDTVFLKEFVRYVASNICGMIGLSCYILADTFFISKGLGARGLAALNLAIPIYSFVHGSGLMVGMGGATKYSICMGQGESEGADNIFSNTVYVAVLLSVVFAAAGMLFSERLASTLGADGEIFGMTKTYLQVILLFAPAFIANDTMICFVRNDGNPQLSMAAMLAGSFSNIVMDYVFIFLLGMGILGAVLATGVAPVISLAVLSKHWILKRNKFHFVKGKPVGKWTGTIISLGLPALITEVASGIVMIIFNGIILKLQGNIGVAAYGVVANLSLVVTAVYTGISQGTQPILSRLYGYGDKGGIKQVMKYAMRFTMCLSGAIYLFFLTKAGSVVGIFNSEQNMQLQQIAENGLKLYFTAVPFVGFNIVISTYFTSTEKALPAQILSLSRGFVLIVPMAYLMAHLVGMTGVYLSYPFTEGIVTVIGVILGAKTNRTAPLHETNFPDTIKR